MRKFITILSFSLITMVFSANAAIGVDALNREEAYLENKFGQDNLAYKEKVRRWL